MARRSKQTGKGKPPPTRLILNAGAVLALARRDLRARAALTAAWEAGAEIVVPAVVVAETVRGNGPRDAPVNRVLSAVGDVAALDEAVARAAGELLARAPAERDCTIDAIVVAECAARGGGVILTGDAGDLTRLADGHPTIVIQPVAAA